MILSEVDWNSFLACAQVWKGMALKSRRELLNNVAVGEPLRRGQLSDEWRLLIESGLVVPQFGGALKLTDGFGAFVKLLRRFRDWGLLAWKRNGAAQNYLKNGFTPEQVDVLIPAGHQESDIGVWLMREAGSGRWAQDFLKAQVPQWEAKRLAAGERPRLAQPELFGLMQRIVARLYAAHAPMRFTELKETFQAAGPVALATVTGAAIRYLLLAPGIESEGLEPILGPIEFDSPKNGSVKPKLRVEAPVESPKVVEARDVFSCAFRMEDMTTLLAHCASQPVRVRYDGEPYAREQKLIGKALVPLPGWVEATFQTSPDYRVRVAGFWLGEFSLCERAGGYNDGHLVASDEGFRWLALSPQARLKFVLDRFRRNNDGSFLIPYYVQIPSLTKAEISESIGAAYGTLAENQPVVMSEFLSCQARTANLLAERSKGKYFTGTVGSIWIHGSDREQLNKAWRTLLSDVCANILLPLGGVALGIHGENDITVAITSVGRYLIKLASNFEYGVETQSEVLVQPNFDVVFLGPAPAAEATIGRFAERVGRQMGTLFRITKKSIFAGAASGITADSALETLRQCCSKPVPDNVEREMRGWFGQCRRVEMRQAMLIHCPDKETAARVISVGGKAVNVISETILELPEADRQADLKRKLRERGIFV